MEHHLPQSVRVERRAVDEAESRRANGPDWDRYADEYQATHGDFLGDAGFLWGPEGHTEDTLGVLGEVAGKDVIILDDEIAKGSTVFELLARLRERNIRSVRVACTHGLFAGDAIERLSAEKDIEEIVCTNTVPIPPDDHTGKLTVLSVAAPLAEAMRRIHNGDSVSALFA